MSVYTAELGGEEFPEMTAVCKSAFTQSTSRASLIPSRTSPLSFSAIDFDHTDGATSTALMAANEFTLVALMSPVDAASPTIGSRDSKAPRPICFTMEDGGQSNGASTTSAHAAMLLAL